MRYQISTDILKSKQSIGFCITYFNIYLGGVPNPQRESKNQERKVNFESEWLLLRPTQQFFNYIMARTIQFSMRWWWGPLCPRPTHLFGFLSASSLIQQSADRHIAPLLTHYPDFVPTSLCSFSLMMRA